MHGTCIVYISYNNTNSEIYNVPVGQYNSFTNLVSGQLTTLFLTGYNYRAETLYYNCTLGYNRRLILNQTFANF